MVQHYAIALLSFFQFEQAVEVDIHLIAQGFELYVNQIAIRLYTEVIFNGIFPTITRITHTATVNKLKEETPKKGATTLRITGSEL